MWRNKGTTVAARDFTSDQPHCPIEHKTENTANNLELPVAYNIYYKPTYFSEFKLE